MARSDQMQAQRRRHDGISRVSTVTGTATAVAAGLTVAVAGGLAVTHASASPTADTGVPASTASTVPAPGDRGTRSGHDPQGPVSGGGLLPAQAPPQAQSQGS